MNRLSNGQAKDGLKSRKHYLLSSLGLPRHQTPYHRPAEHHEAVSFRSSLPMQRLIEQTNSQINSNSTSVPNGNANSSLDVLALMMSMQYNSSTPMVAAPKPKVDNIFQTANPASSRPINIYLHNDGFRSIVPFINLTESATKHDTDNSGHEITSKHFLSQTLTKPNKSVTNSNLCSFSQA